MGCLGSVGVFGVQMVHRSRGLIVCGPRAVRDLEGAGCRVSGLGGPGFVKV